MNMQNDYYRIIIAGILSGFVIFGGQVFVNMGLSFYQISIFPALFIIILAPFIIHNKKCRFERKMLRFFLLFGFLGFISNFTEFLPLLLGVPVGIIVMLLYTHPLWTTIFGKVFFGEKITRNRVISLVTVLIGMIILVNPFTNASIGHPIGVILAVCGGILVSGWFILGKSSGIRKYSPVTTQFGYYAFMLLFLFVSFPIAQSLVPDLSITSLSLNFPLINWVYFLLYTSFAIIVPHLLYFYSSRKVPVSDAGIIFLLEPVGATVLATLFLGQLISLNILIGGALILIANYFVIRSAKSDNLDRNSVSAGQAFKPG